MMKSKEEKFNNEKCIYKTLNVECNQRMTCDGNMKAGCPLAEIANVKSKTQESTSD